MCLILFAYQTHPGYKLVLAANRDEFYVRPTAQAGFWDDAPNVLAGRDLKAGGTWLGVTKAGRFAAVTNYRERKTGNPVSTSRGKLVSGYLAGTLPPDAYLQEVAAEGHLYRGFNLIAGDPDALGYYSNREGRMRPLEPGIYGLSNHVLDTPWPKVRTGKDRLAEILSTSDFSIEALFGLLTDETRAGDDALPDTGVGLEIERMLSSRFIKSETYGTRSSTVLLIDYENRVRFIERTFAAGLPETKQAEFEYLINAERWVPS